MTAKHLPNGNRVEWVYDEANLIGHYLKIVAFWFLYKAFIETNFIKPYNLIFRDLKLSEERYHTLFNNMINGFARHRVLFDKEGKPVDYIFLEVNTAFERLTGLNKDNLIGKRVKRQPFTKQAQTGL